MSVRSAKLGGSASAVLKYLSEEAELTLGYYAPGGGGGRPRQNGDPIDLDNPDAIAFPEVWGKGAQHLGLELGLTVGQYKDLHAGTWNGEKLSKGSPGYRKTTDPETGEVKIEVARTAVIDNVYGCPKSVVEKMIATNDDALRQNIASAAKEAAHAAFVTMEATALIARKGTGGGKSQRLTADLICTPVVQYTARPTEEQIARGAPPDPHLHVHAPVFTACAVEDEAAPGGVRWLTADEYGIKTTAEHRDAVFMGELARRLEDLGLEIEYDDFKDSRNGRISWEVKGSKPDLRKFWSSNTERRWKLTRSFENEHGRPMSQKEADAAMRITRLKKSATDKAQDSRPIWKLWADDALAAGYRLTDYVGLGRPVARKPVKEREATLVDRLYSSNGLCREDSVFTGDTIAAAVARCAVGLGFDRDDLAAFEAELRQHLIPVRTARDDRFAYFTTAVVLSHENYIAQRSSTLASRSFRAPTTATVDRHLERAAVPLDEEQTAAVKAACGSSGWVHIEGFAGAGKTTALKVIVDAHKAEGTATEVIAVSTAANTAVRIGEKLGADRWGSVESICSMVGKRVIRPTTKTLFVVDEAAMMDTARIAALLKAAGPARFVLVGDPAQLAPIGAGGWYAESIDRHGSTMLTKVHRQTDERDVVDYALIREGRATEALDNMANRGRVHISGNAQDRIIDVLADYKAFSDKGYSSGDVRIVLDSSNVLVDTANRFIQADLLARGELRGESFEVEDTQQDRRWLIHNGEQVMFLKPYIDGTGETVRNGETGIVLKLNTNTGRVKLLLDSGRIVVMPLKAQEFDQPLGLAYTQHASKLQGGEAPIVLVMPGTEHSASANSGYSQVTRASKEAHVYLDHETHGEDPIARVGAAWSAADEKHSATWHMAEAATNYMVRDPETAAKAHELRGWLVEDHGEALADKITSAEGYVALVVTVADLQKDGNDARAMVSEAVRERSLFGVDDVAAVVSWRLNHTPERGAEVSGAAEAAFIAQTRRSERAHWRDRIPSNDIKQELGLSL